MRLASFNFTKIGIEKIKDSFKEVKINSKINITNVEAIESEVLKNEEGLIRVSFSYNLLYNPDIAKINFEGKALLIDKKEKIKEIQENWKDKKMTEEFRIALFNIILRKANIKALQLEEEMNLPLHIPLPVLKKQKKE